MDRVFYYSCSDRWTSKGTSAHAGHYATRIIKPLFSWMYFFSLNDIDLLKKINMLYTLVLLLWLSIDRHHHHHYYYSKNNIRIDVMWPCDFKPLNVVILLYNISVNVKVIKRNFIKYQQIVEDVWYQKLCVLIFIFVLHVLLIQKTTPWPPMTN